MYRLHRINSFLSRATLYLACVCLSVLGLLVLYGVVQRYAFNNAQAYVEQVSLLLVIAVSMFGAAAGVHEAGHIGLDSLVKLLPHSARLVVAVAAQVCVLVFSVVLLWGSAHMAQSTLHDTIPTLGISEASRYLPPALAAVLIVLFSLERIWSLLRGQHAV